MRKLVLLALTLILSYFSIAQKENTTSFTIADSLRAVQFMADINVQQINTHKEVSAGIRTDLVKLAFETGSESKIVFEFPSNAKVVATGIDVKVDEPGELEWKYNWSKNENYRLLLSVASDSAENFTLYSGYAWLPQDKKWKLIGTCKISGRWGPIKTPATFYEAPNKKLLKQFQVQNSQVWVQRSNGRWNILQGDTLPAAMANVASHVDSISQHKIDLDSIKQAIATGKSDANKVVDDVYYTMMKEGTGRQVSLTDTVVVFYKGYLLSDGSIFDQTRDKPATFPLNRLIRGWHIGVPLCKVGGKIKIVIPSALAYSIRTRAAKIPPNSILVFEVEVVDTKPKL